MEKLCAKNSQLKPGKQLPEVPYKLTDAAEYVIAPMMPYQPIPDRDAITIGYAGVYSTFLLHARKAAERYQLDPRDILVELGRRKAVAGQEDWILDVAQDLAEARCGANGSHQSVAESPQRKEVPCQKLNR